MIRLSAKAANNMVIVAMLIMMALFNLDALLPRSSVTPITRLFPEDSHVLKITQGDYALERVGQQLRWRGPVIINVDPAEVLAQWHAGRLVRATARVDSANERIEVMVWRAGTRDADLFTFIQTPTRLYVTHNAMTYEVIDYRLGDLLPWYAHQH